MKQLKKIWIITAEIFSLLFYAVTLLAGYSGFINPATWVIPALLGLVFPMLMLGTLLLAVVWNVALHRRMALLSDIVVLVCIYPFLVVSPVNLPEKATPGANVIKVMSYNVFEGEDNEIDSLPYSRTFSYILASDADIVCTVEMLDTTLIVRHYDKGRMQVDSLMKKYPNYMYEERVHCGIFSKYPLRDITDTVYYDEDKKLLYAAYVADVDNSPLTLFIVHLPSYELSDDEKGVVTNLSNGIGGIKKSASDMKHSILSKLKAAMLGRADASDKAAKIIDGLQGDVIVCGDFNDVPGSWAYRRLMDCGLKDVYREVGNGFVYTYNANYMLFHIDQMLYRGNLKPLKFTKGNLRSSDHYPITVDFELLPNRLPDAATTNKETKN